MTTYLTILVFGAICTFIGYMIGFSRIKNAVGSERDKWGRIMIKNWDEYNSPQHWNTGKVGVGSFKSTIGKRRGGV